nr:14185_t:CDS:2 [Entrophospora candida]
MNNLIRIMVQFGKWFYEQLSYFLTTADPCTRIQHNGISQTFPNGHQVHQLPDMELNEARETRNYFFEELNEHLDEKNEYVDLVNKIKAGLVKVLDAFKKWMNIWTHLLLSVCSLGGNHDQAFAQAVIYENGFLQTLNKNTFKELREEEKEMPDNMK